MDWGRKSIRVGAAAICCAIALRFFGGGGMDRLMLTLTSPRVMSVLLLLETGRVVRQPADSLPTAETTVPTQAPETTAAATEPAPTQPPAQPLDVPVFGADDAALVEVNSACGYDADVAACLTQSLSWDLTEAAPTVLIVHSHGTESYENTENYEASSPYRTRDPAYNVVSVGDRLVQVLEKGGVRALHDRQLHDSPSYSDSYGNSRTSVQAYLERYPTIRLVLDIHRDAVEDSQGQQMRFATQADGEAVAQLMMVVGTDASGLTHPDWSKNMSLAVKLHAQLEKLAPGICRPISLRSQRFNQDLSPGALIVEVGGAGNTRQEALAAAELLGQAILALSQGTG